MDEKEYQLNDRELKRLKELKRKNLRRNAYWALMALQAGSLVLCYYLGRTHK